MQIIPSAKGIKGNLEDELGNAGENAGKSGGNKFAAAFKKIITVAAIGKVVKDAISAGADLQQSYGGLDTIYGDAAEAAKQYAAEAAKAGISANSYAEQAVSFGASLKQAFGGDTLKAAEAANTAIMDMADNSAKMGTDIESIQTAYQGFAKQNYTMLDNLKLGYGGTKSEMERLLADAQKLTGVEYNIDNLGDVYDAIHVIQGELGLTGVAADEAKTTFSGSLGAMKAAAQNLLGNLALGEDITPSLMELSDTVVTFLKGNLLPLVQNILMALPEILPDVIVALVDMIDILIPTIIDAGVELFLALAENLPEIITGLVEAVINIVRKLVTTIIDKRADIAQAGKNLILGLKDGIKQAVGAVVDAVSDVCGKILQKIRNLLGIHSPSTVFAEIGEYSMLGLAEGIEGNMMPVQRAIDDVTAMTTTGLQSELGISSKVDVGGTGIGNLIDRIDRLTTALENGGVYLDGDTLVGGIARRMNTAIRNENLMMARGVI